MDTLSDKVTIVVDASSGISHAAAKLFAVEGAKVIVAARRRAGLEALVSEITQAGGDAVAGDVKEESYANVVVDLALTKCGGLDVAFINVDTFGAMGPTPDVSLCDWTHTVETNLTSAFRAAKYQVPANPD